MIGVFVGDGVLVARGVAVGIGKTLTCFKIRGKYFPLAVIVGVGVRVIVGLGVWVAVEVGADAVKSITNCGMYGLSRVPKPRQLESSPEISGPRNMTP